MKKKLFLKFFVLAVIGAFVTFTSCKDYDDDINKLTTELNQLKGEVASKSDLETLKTQLEASIAALEAEIDGFISQGDLDEALAGYVKLTTFNEFKDWVEDEIAELKSDLAKAATKEEVEALEARIDSDLDDIRAEYRAAITNLETILGIVDGESTVLKQIQDDIAENKGDIAAVAADLLEKYNELKELIQDNADEIADIKDDIADIYDEIDNLYDEIGRLDGKIDNLDAKVEAYKDELDEQIERLDGRIDVLNALIVNVFQDLDHRVVGLTFIPDFTSDDGTPQIVVNGLTEWRHYKPASASHSSIWYAPDWTSSWDENWAVLKRGKIYKGVTTLRYKVSPSNVTLNDFQIHQLVHKTSMVRASEEGEISTPIELAGRAELANGVLSVPVVVEIDDYDINTLYDTEYHDTPTSGAQTRAHSGYWGYNVSVALQVENLNVAMDNNEERIVTSTEYIKVNFDLNEGRIALNDKSLKADGTILPVGINYNNIAGIGYASDISLWNGKSQDGNMADVLNHTINLNDYIYGIFRDYYGDWEKMLDWGFDKHVFKFRRVYLQSEGVNQTNDYVDLNPDTGVIGVVPANNGQNVNQAADGRTPIVEVTAVVDGKVHAVGYIKIHITDQFDNKAIEFEFTLEDYLLGCNSSYGLTDVDIDEIDFDQIFNHPRIQLGKDAFFNEYKQGGLTGAQVVNVSPTSINGVNNLPGSVPATAGVTNAEDVWFTWAINPQTQSVNLYNYLEGNINNDAPHGYYEIKTTLTSNGYRPDVIITWKFNVVLPTNLWLTPNEVFLYNGIYKVEPTVYWQTPTPKTSTPYEGLLQNAYEHSNMSLDLGEVAGDQDCPGYLTPYFVFTKAPSGFHINTTGTRFGQAYEIRQSVTNDLAAQIFRENDFNAPGTNPKNFFQVGGWYIVLNDQTQGGSNSQIGNYKVLSNAAKALVAAGWVEVQARGYINGQQLNHVPLHDPFRVTFTYPIEFNFEDQYEVWDQGTGSNQRVTIPLIRTGSTIAGWNNNSVIKDFLGNDIVFSSTSGSGANNGNNHRALVDHYEIARIVSSGSYVPTLDWDFSQTAVKTNLPSGVLPQGMSFKIDTSLSTGSNPNFNQLVIRWENASGASTQNPFEVYIPVSIDHKWGTLEGTVTVLVNPGTGN